MNKFKKLDSFWIDGYTVSDVVMYWMDTPVNGVEDAKLHQFTIVGYETTDRKESLATGIIYLFILKMLN